MPQYKLTYFPVRGAAEIIRLTFAQCGVEYEDNRVTRDDWKELKPNVPFGQLPMLEVDGTIVVQSLPIAKYIAKEHGLGGKSTLEDTQIDMMIGCIQDTFDRQGMQIFFEKDADKKEQMKQKWVNEDIPNHFSQLEKMLVTNKGGDGFFVGDSVSVADILFFRDLEFFTLLEVTVDMAKYPKLNALSERVANLPRIKEWVEKRPKTSH